MEYRPVRVGQVVILSINEGFKKKKNGDLIPQNPHFHVGRVEEINGEGIATVVRPHGHDPIPVTFHVWVYLVPREYIMAATKLIDEFEGLPIEDTQFAVISDISDELIRVRRKMEAYGIKSWDGA